MVGSFNDIRIEKRYKTDLPASCKLIDQRWESPLQVLDGIIVNLSPSGAMFKLLTDFSYFSKPENINSKVDLQFLSGMKMKFLAWIPAKVVWFKKVQNAYYIGISFTNSGAARSAMSV